MFRLYFNDDTTNHQTRNNFLLKTVLNQATRRNGREVRATSMLRLRCHETPARGVGGGVPCQETREQPTAVVSTAARVCVVVCCSGRASMGLRAQLVLVLLALKLTLQLDLPGGGRVQEKSHVESTECANVQRDEILDGFTSRGVYLLRLITPDYV